MVIISKDAVLRSSVWFYDRTKHQSFLNFCKIPRNPTAISKFREKEQISRLDSEFRDPRKTVGPYLVTSGIEFCMSNQFKPISAITYYNVQGAPKNFTP